MDFADREAIWDLEGAIFDMGIEADRGRARFPRPVIEVDILPRRSQVGFRRYQDACRCVAIQIDLRRIESRGRGVEPPAGAPRIASVGREIDDSVRSGEIGRASCRERV